MLERLKAEKTGYEKGRRQVASICILPIKDLFYNLFELTGLAEARRGEGNTGSEELIQANWRKKIRPLPLLIERFRKLEGSKNDV